METSCPQDLEPHIDLRRCILLTLYAAFREHPYAPVEMREIGETCQTSAPDLNWNMVYLEKCGLVELGRGYDTPPYIAAAASISAAGIDLVEDPPAFGRRFPQGQAPE